DLYLARCDRDEVGLPILGREGLPLAEACAAPLHLIAGLRELLDTCVRRHDPRYLAADGERVLETHEAGALGRDARREVEEDLPLRPRLARTRARDLRTERDAPLGGRLGAAAALLVARRSREEHHGLARLEHLRRDDDVLVDAKRHARQGAT